MFGLKKKKPSKKAPKNKKSKKSKSRIIYKGTDVSAFRKAGKEGDSPKEVSKNYKKHHRQNILDDIQNIAEEVYKLSLPVS